MSAAWSRSTNAYTLILWIDGRGIGVLEPLGNPDVSKVAWSFTFFDSGEERQTIGVYNYKELDEARKEVANMIRFRGEKMAEAVKKSVT